MQSLPSPTALRMFVEAARRSSFAGAAGELNVTQAAVSKQVASLEVRLGVLLFERGHRSVTLTMSGEGYLPVAERVLALLETGRSTALGLSEREKLTVMIDHEFLDFVLAPRLGRLRTQLPNLDVSFVPETSRRRAPHCDLAITFGHPGDDGIDIERLCEFSVFVVGAPSLVESSAAPLSELPLLHDVDEYWWDAILLAENVIRDDPGIVLGHGAIAVRAAIAGVGLAVGDDLLCADALSSGDLVQVSTTRLSGRADYWISSSPSSPETKTTRIFRNWVRDEIRILENRR